MKFAGMRVSSLVSFVRPSRMRTRKNLLRFSASHSPARVATSSLAAPPALLRLPPPASLPACSSTIWSGSTTSAIGPAAPALAAAGEAAPDANDAAAAAEAAAPSPVGGEARGARAPAGGVEGLAAAGAPEVALEIA
jgi:hypothetical protein